MNISRRTFLVTGALGAIALATAGWLRGPHAPASGTLRRALDADGEAILLAIAPVLLADALPAHPEQRQQALRETVTALDAAIHGLPPSAQAELAQLFALLALPPIRLAFARIMAPWPQAAPLEVRALWIAFAAARGTCSGLRTTRCTN